MTSTRTCLSDFTTIGCLAVWLAACGGGTADVSPAAASLNGDPWLAQRMPAAEASVDAPANEVASLDTPPTDAAPNPPAATSIQIASAAVRTPSRASNHLAIAAPPEVLAR